MRRSSIAFALGLALAPWAASAQTNGYTLDDYQLRTSGDLLDICSLDSSHAGYYEARGFCLGYFAGGIDLHDALAAGRDFPQLACPTGQVTRDDVVAVFVNYARAHPEHLNERPMDTVFRAVSDEWPCDPQAK
jgi:Rap1a immunity proteins